MKPGLQTDKKGQEEESNPPRLKSKYVPCEWKLDWANKNSAICGQALTAKEIKFCEKHKIDLGGRMLCFGHQDQYIKKFN